MYDNIGGKIKGLAKAMFIVEVIGAVIAGIALVATDAGFILIGLLTLFCGPIIAWVGSWILYAFGELVEDIHAIRNKEGTVAEEKAKREADIKRTTEEIIDNTPVVYETVMPVHDKKHDTYACPSCGSALRKGQEQCLCRKMLDWNNFQ